MTLTVVVGSSGSGKTTFLNDVHKHHKCTYIRQFHNIRPYVIVSRIPNFDPSQLPYWSIYENEGKAKTIRAGGTMAGEFTAGLSGGQRKLLLFELVHQRIQKQKDLLLCLDEPFAGVTDDFVPFIVDRLNKLRQNHNILLVTNDHVQTLADMADNTITVCAIDRSNVQVNNLEQRVPRDKCILALSVGNNYVYTASSADLRFFLDVEIISNGGLMSIGVFTTIAFALFLITFISSSVESASLVMVASSLIAFFCVNPYLLALVDWRIFMTEEAEALLHASASRNKLLKILVIIVLMVIVSVIQYVTTIIVFRGGFADYSFWFAMFFDSFSMTVAVVFLGLYTTLPFQAVELLAEVPFLMMIFFSTTFSPGSGLAVVKELRYLFSRFYWWCLTPGVQEYMEGCPSTKEANVVYMVLSGMIIPVLYLFYACAVRILTGVHKEKISMENEKLKDKEYHELQNELYGDRVKTETATDALEP